MSELIQTLKKLSSLCAPFSTFEESNINASFPKNLDTILNTANAAKVQFREWMLKEKFYAILRGSIQRFRMRKLGGFHATILKQRCTLFNEFLRAEIEYINILQHILVYYVDPLKKEINEKRMKNVSLDLFGPISSVHTLAQQFKDMLMTIYEDDWPNFSRAGSVFLALAPCMALIGTYAHNYPSVKEDIATLEKNDSKFAQFLTNCSTKSRADTTLPVGMMKMHITELLKTPLQHMDFYKTILEKFFVLSCSLTESECLNAAFSVVQRISDFVTLSHNLTLNRNTFRQIMKKLDNTRLIENGPPENKILEQKNTPSSSQIRSFVEEGDFQFVTIKSKTLKQPSFKPIHYVLLSDCLITCKVSSAAYKIKEVYWLVEAQLGYPLGVDPIIGAEILLHTHDGKGIRIRFENARTRSAFEVNLRSLIAQVSGNKLIFGRHLSELLLVENGSVPKVLKELVTQLIPFLSTEGIFRISGSRTRVYELLTLFNSGEWNTITKQKKASFGPYDFADTFKLYFQMLPEPLMTYDGYSAFSDLLISYNNNLPDDKDSLITEILDIVNSLPETNRGVVEFLFEFFTLIAEESDANKMTPTNLSLCFTPSILKPKDESIMSTIYCVKMSELMAILIEYYATQKPRLIREASSTRSSARRVTFGTIKFNFDIPSDVVFRNQEAIKISQSYLAAKQTVRPKAVIPTIERYKAVPPAPKKKPPRRKRQGVELDKDETKRITVRIEESEKKIETSENENEKVKEKEKDPKEEIISAGPRDENNTSKEQKELIVIPTQAKEIAISSQKETEERTIIGATEKNACVPTKTMPKQSGNLQSTFLPSSATQTAPRQKPASPSPISNRQNSATLTQSRIRMDPPKTLLNKQSETNKEQSTEEINKPLRSFSSLPQPSKNALTSSQTNSFSSLPVKTLVQLRQKPLDPNLDKNLLPFYLSDADFMNAFKMSKDEFSKTPVWKQTHLRKQHDLF